MKKILSFNFLIPVAILLVAFFVVSTMQSQAEVYSNSCTVSTSTAVTIGPTSSTLMATSSNRAWAIIQAKPAETSTLYLKFDEGESATVNNGFALGTTTEDMNKITFGRNTEFPYTGTVTGITNTATTTVLVTECVY